MKSQYISNRDNKASISLKMITPEEVEALNLLLDGRVEERKPSYDEWMKTQSQAKVVEMNEIEFKKMPTAYKYALEVALETIEEGNPVILHVIDDKSPYNRWFHSVTSALEFVELRFQYFCENNLPEIRLPTLVEPEEPFVMSAQTLRFSN
jgi:hypothetical protein